jgi:hypothetical protein
MEWQVIGTGLGIIGFTYGFLRNFKNDVNKRIDRLETRLSLSITFYKRPGIIRLIESNCQLELSIQLKKQIDVIELEIA